MNTEQFLSLILPDQGKRVIVSFPGKAAPKHTYHDTNVTAARAVMTSEAKSFNTYHACATFKGMTRKAADVLAVKSFWLDIDVGDGKPYPTQSEAVQALELFSEQLGLPTAFVVSSGSGVHVYWVLDAPITSAEWLITAQLLKTACVNAGMRADPSRTADVASILRPVGSRNYKGAPTPVEMIVDGEITSHDAIRTALYAYCGSGDGIEISAPPAYIASMGLDNSALAMPYEISLPQIGPIVAACGIIREFRDSQGCLEEPLWRGCLGVIAFCEDGVETCHEWSSGHPNYSRAETQAKIDGVLTFKPTRCATLQPHRPDVCAACTLRATCVSPIKAGYVSQHDSEPEEAQAPAALQQLSTTPAVTPAAMTRPTLPHGFSWAQDTHGKHYIHSYMQVKDSTDPSGYSMKNVPVTESLFYPIDKIVLRDGTHVLNMVLVEHTGKHKIFTLETKLIAEGGSKLLSCLGGYMITSEPKMGSELQKYLLRWMNLVSTTMAGKQAYSHFGWHDKNFLIGDTLYKPDGTQETVMLTGSADVRRGNFVPKGSLQAWVDLVDRVYNHKGVESLQFAMLTGLASPLLKMFKDYGGVMVYMHSEGTGKGKTTIERAALSAWCSWERIQITHKQATSNSIYAIIGMLSNMPVVIDELTKIANNEVAELVHLISAGTSKERCTQTGALAENDNRWNTFVLGSGNMLLTEKLAQDRAHAAAEIARIWEYTIAPNSPVTPDEAMQLFPKFSDNYGHAGRAFMKYVVENEEAVRVELFSTQQWLVQNLGLTQGERYWTVLLACVLTARKIAVMQGLLAFPLAPLLHWIKRTLEANRGNMTSAVVQPEDLLGQLLNDVWQGMLITQGAGHLLRGQDAFVTQRPHGAVVGRVITPVIGATGAPEVYLSAAVARAWCNKRGVSAREVFKASVAAGLLGARELRFQLGSGSKEYVGLGGSIPCWQVLPGAAAAYLGNPAGLTVLQGGRSTP